METPEANLSRVMHYLNGSYNTYFNVKCKRSGHLFQGRYKAIVVDRDRYLLELSRYIHLNPVRAGIKARPEEYPHSSYGSYLAPNEDSLVCREVVLALVTENRKDVVRKYREYVESMLGEEAESPLCKLYGGIVLGGERFIRNVLQNLPSDQLEYEEVSHRKALRSGIRAEDIVRRICNEQGCVPAGLANAENRKLRNLAVYLIKRQTAATNREVGEMFGGLSYSAIAKICQRFERKLEGDRELSREVARLSRVKG
jgi:hypothetical protein